MTENILRQLLILQINEHALFNALNIAIKELNRIMDTEGDHTRTEEALREIVKLNMATRSLISNLVDGNTEPNEILH